MILNALMLNLDLASATYDSAVVEETCKLVSSELVTIIFDVNGFTHTPGSFQVLQHPPNASCDWTLRYGNGASNPNVLVISAPNS